MLLTAALEAADPGIASLMNGSAAATQVGGGILGTAVVLILVYWQYRRRPSTLDGKAEAAGIAMIEAIRADSAESRRIAESCQDELRKRDRLAREHEAYDRKILNILSLAGLLTDDIGVPPPLVPPIEEEPVR